MYRLRLYSTSNLVSVSTSLVARAGSQTAVSKTSEHHAAAKTIDVAAEPAVVTSTPGDDTTTIRFFVAFNGVVSASRLLGQPHARH